METIFSKMLVKLRKDAGFRTSYQFYHDNCGKGVLKMSYRYYLMIEQGKALPAFEKLDILIWALRMIPKSTEANVFVHAWLQTMAGPDKFKGLLEPLMTGRPDAPGLSAVQKAMKYSMSARKYFITVEQLKVIYANQDNYLCYLAMTNDTGVWAVKRVAAKLDLKESAVAASLKALAGAKMVKQAKKGLYTCPIATMVLHYPPMDSLPAELQAKIRDNIDKLAAVGEHKFRSRIIIRADETDFCQFFPIMTANIHTAESYSLTEKTDKSALFMVEGKVVKLRDF